ncbi:MAG: PSD1 and planctomycete cytochrome C domain-containing protein [Opitutaceae bacterium]
MKTLSASSLALIGVAFAANLYAAAPAAAPRTVSATDMQFFENKIRPILVEKCYKCHSREADKVRGGFLLDSHDGLLEGGSTGPAIVPGKPDESLLIQAIRYKDPDLQMPPKGDKLSDREIADLTEWVRRGAPDPRGLASKSGAPSKYGGVGRQHWSFQPLTKPAVPTIKTPEWSKTPVDNFILAKLEDAGLEPNAPADRRTLIRRVSFDLTGLPPTEAETSAFVADQSPDAYAKVVDRLLASPQYGERWGRYWLDVARYSDTKGEPEKRRDPRYPHAWTYRDYVINAFNTDKPYNDFIVEQLAADRVVAESSKKILAKDPKAVIDQTSLAALGFLTLGNKFEGRDDDIINDRIDVTTKAFLGLTVSCARCHDHKFDPIPTKDFYSLYGVFANTYEPTIPAELPTLFSRLRKTPELEDYLAKLQDLKANKAKADQEFAELQAEFRRTRTRDQQKNQMAQRQQTLADAALYDLEATHPGAPARAHGLVDVQRSRDYPVLIRGESKNVGDVVPRRFLEILSPDPKKRPEWHDHSGRLELAHAIADPKNPLTARVLVNRVWQQHFGEGFVPTPDDLGNMSAPPTHPELVDYLASRFVEDGWSIKKLHRLILLSNTYQESSNANAKYADIDPDNKLHWRYNMRRLDFESVHDSLLAIAGTLDLKLGGKAIPIGSEDFATRRAVYTFIDRRNPAEILTQFDFPSPNVPTGKRYMTIVPQQSLFMMNSPLVIETARKLTHRPEFLSVKSDEERVASLYLAIFQRPPNAQETALSLRYVESNPGGTSTEAPIATLQSKAASRQAELQAMQAKNAAKNLRGKNAYQAEPGGAAFKSRAPIDAWTKLAHALFQTNEAMFYN